MSFWIVPESACQSAPCCSATTRYIAKIIGAGELIVIDVVMSPSGMPVEQRLHVGERGDVHAALPHLAERQRMVGIAAHQRRQIERDAQARCRRPQQLPCSARSSPPACRTPRTAASSRACRGSRSDGCRACTGTRPDRRGRARSRRRPGPRPCRARSIGRPEIVVNGRARRLRQRRLERLTLSSARCRRVRRQSIRFMRFIIRRLRLRDVELP